VADKKGFNEVLAIEQRGSRYKDLLPLGKLQKADCYVVGVGAIGRQVALQLATMGCEEITVIDDGKVEAVNCGPQGYSAWDIDAYKVDVLDTMLADVNPEATITAVNRQFGKETLTMMACEGKAVVFCCVDSIVTRDEIFRKVLSSGTGVLFIDGRMAAEACRVISVDFKDKEAIEYYGKTIFKPEEAYEAPCTAKSTFYCATLAASLMVAQFTKWLRGFPLDRDFQVNILANEMVLIDVSKEPKEEPAKEPDEQLISDFKEIMGMEDSD
jgi:sulfur carrier protein ThiS adenylyltransferase